MTYELDGDHGVFLDAPGRFAAILVAACEAVLQPDATADLTGQAGAVSPPA